MQRAKNNSPQRGGRSEGVPEVTVGLRMASRQAIDARTLEAIQRAATLHRCEFRIRAPKAPLQPWEHRALALEVCRPFGEAKTWRGGGA